MARTKKADRLQVSRRRPQTPAVSQSLSEIIATEEICFICGCTPEDACVDEAECPCSWADAAHMVCSVCFGALGDLAIGWLLNKAGSRA